MQLNYFLSSVPAGFPSPADDFIEARLDLHQHIVKNPSTTFFMRASDDIPSDIGISPGDLLVVDRSRFAKNGALAIVELDGQLCVRKLQKAHQCFLIEDRGSLLKLGESNALWGCISHVIHEIR